MIGQRTVAKQHMDFRNLREALVGQSMVVSLGITLVGCGVFLAKSMDDRPQRKHQSQQEQQRNHTTHAVGNRMRHTYAPVSFSGNNGRDFFVRRSIRLVPSSLIYSTKCDPAAESAGDIDGRSQSQDRRTNRITALQRSQDEAPASFVQEPTLIRRALHWFRIVDLPLPRFIQPGDPSLKVAASVQKQRQRDEHKVRELQQQLEKVMHTMQSFMNDNKKEATKTQLQSLDEQQKLLGSLASQQYELFYGPGVTPQDRVDFLARYGCTAWTPAVLQRLVELGDGRGFVEVGAGHGQWARAIEEEHRTRIQLHNLQQQQLENNQQTPSNHKSVHQPLDFVLAYDDWSRLPLDPNIYHAGTKPHAAYFGKVHRIRRPQSQTSSSSTSTQLQTDPLDVLLSQWKHRGRVLLLVFPTPALAIQSVKAYATLGPENDTVVYVGEGRGGANAGDDFFDFLEGSVTDNNNVESGNAWVLVDVLPVRPFGTKGFEKLYIFQKKKHVQSLK